MEGKNLATGGAAGWSELSEGLISGVHHALNNRMAAIRAVGQVLDADLPAHHPLGGALTAELDRLEQTARTLRLLGVVAGERVPVQIGDVLRDATTLFEAHHDLRDTALEIGSAESSLPVLVDPDGILRGLLIILSQAASGNDSVEVGVEGNEATVSLLVQAASFNPDEAALAEAERLLGAAGGEVKLDVAGVRVEMLTLPEARRRGG